MPLNNIIFRPHDPKIDNLKDIEKGVKEKFQWRWLTELDCNDDYFEATFERSTNLQGQSGISQDCRPSSHNIMAALLQTDGPVSTQAMLTSNWRFLNLLNVKQFQAAANNLQSMGLGMLASVQNSSRSTQVFVKKPPDQVREILQQNPQLRTDPDYYAHRYAMPASKKIKLNMRAKLVSMGLLQESQLMI